MRLFISSLPKSYRAGRLPYPTRTVICKTLARHYSAPLGRAKKPNSINKACHSAWTLRGHIVDTSMDTLSPIPPMECPCPLLPSGRQRREAPPLAVPRCHPLPLAKFSVGVAEEVCTGEPTDIHRSCPASLAHRSNLRSPRLPLSAPGGAASNNARCFRPSSIWSHYSMRSLSVGSWILGIVLPVSRARARRGT
jgi:hypothetical protein